MRPHPARRSLALGQPRAICAPSRERLAQSRLTRRADYLRLDWGYETTLALRALPEVDLPRLAPGADGDRRDLPLRPPPRPARQAGRSAPPSAAPCASATASCASDRTRACRPTSSRSRPTPRRGTSSTQMSAGDLRTFRTAVFVTVARREPQALAAATGQVVRALGDAGGTSVDRCQLWQVPAWQATLPLAENPAGLAYRTVTPNLGRHPALPPPPRRDARRAADRLRRAGRRGGTLDLLRPRPAERQPPLRRDQRQRQDPLRPGLRPQAPGAGRAGDRLRPLAAPLGRAGGGGARRGGRTVGLASGFRVNPGTCHEEPSPSQAKLEYLLDLHALLLGERHDGVAGLTAAERALLEGPAGRSIAQVRGPPRATPAASGAGGD